MTADEAISCNFNVFFLHFVFLRNCYSHLFSVFEDARGHKIKRENYLNKLRSLSKNSSDTLDSDSKSGDSSPSRNIAKPRLSSSRSRRARPTPRAPPSDYRNGNWRDDRPSASTSFSHSVDRYQSKRHERPLPYHPQNGNWRDPSHHYTFSRPMHLNAIQSQSHRNQQEPNRPNRTHPSSSSRYTWRKDHHL